MRSKKLIIAMIFVLLFSFIFSGCSKNTSSSIKGNGNDVVPRLWEDGIFVEKIGSWDGDKFTGTGKIVYFNGNTYEGDIVENMREGEGKLFSLDGDLIYDGEWENSEPKDKIDKKQVEEKKVEKDEKLSKEITDENIKNKINEVFDGVFYQGIENYYGLYNFDKNISDEKIIEMYLNNRNYEYRDLVGTEDCMAIIPAEVVDKFSLKYFNRKIKEHKLPQRFNEEGDDFSHEVDYKDGCYYIIMADGEGWCKHKVKKLYDKGNGEFTALIYEYGMGDSSDEAVFRTAILADLEFTNKNGKGRYIATSAKEVDKDYVISIEKDNIKAKVEKYKQKQDMAIKNKLYEDEFIPYGEQSGYAQRVGTASYYLNDLVMIFENKEPCSIMLSILDSDYNELYSNEDIYDYRFFDIDGDGIEELIYFDTDDEGSIKILKLNDNRVDKVWEYGPIYLLYGEHNLYINETINEDDFNLYNVVVDGGVNGKNMSFSIDTFKLDTNGTNFEILSLDNYICDTYWGDDSDHREYSDEEGNVGLKYLMRDFLDYFEENSELYNEIKGIPLNSFDIFSPEGVYPRFIVKNNVVKDIYRYPSEDYSIEDVFDTIKKVYGEMDEAAKGDSEVLSVIAKDIETFYGNLFNYYFPMEDGTFELNSLYLRNYSKPINDFKQSIYAAFEEIGIVLNRDTERILKLTNSNGSSDDIHDIGIDEDIVGYLDYFDKIIIDTSGIAITLDTSTLKEDLNDGDLWIGINKNQDNTLDIAFKDNDGNIKNKIVTKIKISIPVEGDFSNKSVHYIGDTFEDNIGGQYNPYTNCFEVEINQCGNYGVKENTVSFNDLDDKDEEMKYAILNMVQKGILMGRSDNEFKPDEYITRSEFTAAMVKTFYELDRSLKTSFTDVIESDWDYPYVASSENANIVKGYPDHTFKGEKDISREEVISVCSRALVEKKNYIYPENIDEYLVYKDKKSISDYAKKEVALAVKEGLLSNEENGKLKPQSSMTRGEAALMINVLYNKLYETYNFEKTTKENTIGMNFSKLEGKGGENQGSSFETTNYEEEYEEEYEDIVWDYVEASSTLTDKYGTYYPENICDGNKGTSWVEGVEGDGVGEWIALCSDTPVVVHTIEILNGYKKSESIYSKNNRLKSALIEFSDGTSFTYNFKDGLSIEDKIELDYPIETDYIKLTILDVYKGNKYSDTCISEIKAY